MDYGQIGWLAGITDGEGCIRGFQIGNRLHVGWQVKMTCLKTMQLVRDLVREITGRKFKLHRVAPLAPRKEQWYLSVRRRSSVRQILAMLRPLLVTKAAQADIVLRICEIPMHGKPRAERPDWLPGCLEAMKALNARGIPSQAPIVGEGVETGSGGTCEGTVQS